MKEVILGIEEAVKETGNLPFDPNHADKKLKEAGIAFSDGEFQTAEACFIKAFINYKLLQILEP